MIKFIVALLLLICLGACQPGQKSPGIIQLVGGRQVHCDNLDDDNYTAGFSSMISCDGLEYKTWETYWFTHK